MMSREKRIRLMGDAMEALLDTMSFRKGGQGSGRELTPGWPRFRRKTVLVHHLSQIHIRAGALRTHDQTWLVGWWKRLLSNWLSVI